MKVSKAGRWQQRLRLVGILWLALLTGSCTQQQDVKVLRMAHTLDQQHVVHKAMEKMASQLAHYSGGKLQIRIYSGGQLGSERELIELL